jgi:hypothetical protein
MPAIYRRRRSVRRGEGEGKHGAGGVERKKAAPASFGDWLGMSVWRRKRREHGGSGVERRMTAPALLS